MRSTIRTNNLKYHLKRKNVELQKIFCRLSLRRTDGWLYRLIIFLISLYLFVGPFIASTHSIDYTHPISKNPNVSISGYTNLNLTWTSRRNANPTPISAGDRISGDNIILKAEWQPAKDINWTHLVVNASAIPALLENETQTNIAELNTRYLGNNATCVIYATAGLKNGSILNEIVHNVFLGNFFLPHVVVTIPNGGEVWTGIKHIMWQAWDMNAEESLSYQVLLSSDYNKTPQLLSSGLIQTWLEWNFSDLVNSSSYKVIVRVTDGIYTTADASDGSFTAGLINPTTTSITTSTSTTATTTLTEYDIRVVFFLVALMASSILIALVAYYKAKRL